MSKEKIDVRENVEFKSYDEYDYVSIWIGRCDNHKKWLEYLELNYVKINNDEIGYEMGYDFGIGSYEPDWVIANYLEEPTKDINKLLDTGIPDYVIEHFAGIYRDELEENYNCMVAIYDMHYDGHIKKVINKEYGTYLYLGSMQSNKEDMF